VRKFEDGEKKQSEPMNVEEFLPKHAGLAQLQSVHVGVVMQNGKKKKTHSKRASEKEKNRKKARGRRRRRVCNRVAHARCVMVFDS
jgi:hypothetical protein